MSEKLILKDYDKDTRYLGYYSEGQRDGFGQLSIQNKKKIHGMWKEDSLEGVALIIDDEMIYVGEVQNGKKSGFAKFKIKGKSEISKLSKFEDDQFVEEIEDENEKIFEDVYIALKNKSLDFELGIETAKMASLIDWYAILQEFEVKREKKRARKVSRSRSNKNSGNRNVEKRQLSPNKKIPEIVKKDIENFNSEYQSIDLKGTSEPDPNKLKNKRSKIYLKSGDKIIPYLENVKKLHKDKVLVDGKVKLIPESNLQEEKPKTDFDDTELIFGERLEGEPGLEEYKDILERDRRIQVYYKSYLDKIMREKPKDWVEKIGKKRKFKTKKKEKSDDPVPELWDEFLGEYNSGRIYMPGVRPDKEFDQMTDEEKKVYLFNTDYKPPWEKYVESKRKSPQKKSLPGKNLIFLIILEPDNDSKKVTFNETVEFNTIPLKNSHEDPEFEAKKQKLKDTHLSKLYDKLSGRDKYAMPNSWLEENRNSEKYTNLRSKTPIKKREKNRHRGNREKNLSYSPLNGKKRHSPGKRWGDYDRTVNLIERGRLEQMPVCHHFFDPLNFKTHNSREEWQRRVEPYSYESTKNYFDSRPKEKILSKVNKDLNFAKMFPEKGKSKSRSPIGLKHTGKIKPRKSGKRKQQDEIIKGNLHIGQASIPIKIRSAKNKMSTGGAKRFSNTSKKNQTKSSKSRSVKKGRPVEISNFEDSLKKASEPFHNRFQNLGHSRVGKSKSKSRSKKNE